MPSALLHNLKHNKVLHARNASSRCATTKSPTSAGQPRATAHDLGHDCWQVALHFGFKDEPHVPNALTLLSLKGELPKASVMETSYFLSRDIIVAQHGRGMALWREKLFAQMYRNASSAADFLHLPNRNVVELGSQIVI